MCKSLFTLHGKRADLTFLALLTLVQIRDSSDETYGFIPDLSGIMKNKTCPNLFISSGKVIYLLFK